MSSPTVVAFFGPLHCGKSSAASLLIEKYGFLRHGVGDGPKEMLRPLGLTDRHLYGDLKEVPCEELNGKTPRYALQSLASQWGRDLIDRALWVKRWYRFLPPGATHLVVDDVRTHEGADYFVSQGAMVVKIERPGLNMDDEQRNHDTEKHFGTMAHTHVLVNDGTLDEFIAKVDALVNPTLS